MAELEQGHGAATFTPAGDIMAHNANAALAAIEALFGAGAANLTVDMRNVEMLDSSGIGLLITALNHANRRQGGMRVVNLSADVFKMLEVMRLTQRFHASRRDGR